MLQGTRIPANDKGRGGMLNVAQRPLPYSLMAKAAHPQRGLRLTPGKLGFDRWGGVLGSRAQPEVGRGREEGRRGGEERRGIQ